MLASRGYHAGMALYGKGEPFGPPDWRKSSYSFANGQCVEVRGRADAVDVRDSKNPDGPVLRFSHGAWEAFTSAVKSGRIGHP